MLSVIAPQELRVELFRQEAVMVVAVAGELDTSTVPRLHEALVQALAAGAPRVVLDLTAVSFIDSSGVAILVRGLRRATAQGTPLHLVVTHPALEKLLTLTGLNKMFAVYRDLKAATSADP